MGLTKNEVQNIIIKHLEENPKTQLASIRHSVEHVLESRGITGKQVKGGQFLRTEWIERISDEDALLINEVIYDLLYDRIITPGINASNLDLPWVHVSSREKLSTLKASL
ncbi:hypothetical protein ABEX44_22815 [Priestia megaterium]